MVIKRGIVYLDSILITIKKLLGPDSEYTHFDTDIIIHINSALMNLNQLGIGPEEGFSITGTEEVWSQLLQDTKRLEAVKTYIYLKVKLVFDPPVNAFVVDAIEREITQLEWRLNVQNRKEV